MQKLSFTNSLGETIDLTGGSYGVTEWNGLSECSIDIQSQSVPFHDGSVYLDSLLGDRELSFTVAINDGGVLYERYRLKREMISILNPKIGEGVLVYTNDYISKQIKCVPDIPTFPTKNMNDGGTLKSSVSFTANDPYWEDVDETEVTVHNHETVTIDSGSDFPLNVKMSIDGASENPSIYNLTNQNTVALRGNFNNLEISSLFGKKSVTSTENKFVYNAGKFEMIVTNDTQLMKVSSGVVLKNIFGETDTSFDFENNSEFIDMVYSEYFGLYIGIKGSDDDETDYQCADIYTSSDGLTWNHNKIVTGYGGYPEKICVDDSNGKVLILNSWYSIVSTDCIDWELHQFPYSVDFEYLNDCVYCNNLSLFVAVGYDNTQSYVVTSSDGINWTTLNVLTSGWMATSIAYSSKNGIIVVVGNKGNYAMSSDLTTWTENVTNSENYWNKIRYIEEINKFVAVGNDGLVSISTDGGGSDAISVIDTGYGYDLKAVTAWRNNLTIYANDVNGNILTSIDGQSWTIETNGINLNISSIAYSDKLDLFVAVGLPKALITSSDGKLWTYNSIELSHNLYSIAWSDTLELFVAVGENGLIYNSSDGLNWNSQTNGFTQNLYSIRWIPEIEKFIVMGRSNFLFSSDGLNWNTSSSTTSTLSSRVRDTNIMYSNGKLYTTDYMEANAITIYISEDEGLTWTTQTISRQNHNSIWGHIYFSSERNLFFILGAFINRIEIADGVYRTENGLCLWTSIDGVTWEEKSFPQGEYDGSQQHQLWCCIKKGNSYLAISNRGEIFSSSDIFNWTLLNYFEDFYFSTMILAKGSAYIGGTNIILNSKDETINSIDSLTSNSNIDFKLNIGENEIFYVNKIDSDLKISFRKKYLGV